MFQTKFVEKIETHILHSIFFLNPWFLCDKWKRTAEPNRTQMTIWRIRILCRIPKATDTYLEYLILIAFPLTQQLHKGASMLCSNVYGLSCYVLR